MWEAARSYLLLAQAVVRGQMQYRFGIATRALGLIMAYMASLANMYFLTQRYGNINGWDFGSLIFLFGLAVLSWGVVLVTFFHFRDLEEYIISGQFDLFLTRPLSPFVHYMASRFPIFSLGQLCFSTLVFVWATLLVRFEWTVAKALFLVPTVIGGALIQGAVCVLVGCAAFWSGRSRMIYHAVVRPAREMAFYPIDIYPLALQALFVWVFPLAFVNFFPAHLFLDRAASFPGWIPFLTPIVGFGFLLVALGFWQRGLRNYQGTGS